MERLNGRRPRKKLYRLGKQALGGNPKKDESGEGASDSDGRRDSQKRGRWIDF